ncbi:MAG TPA: DUF2782 domain-containing protein [Gammaproteobacteria bacterium]|nr:DUF2782 domain-containing protein [Gammaproteobacteria bacterium]
MNKLSRTLVSGLLLLFATQCAFAEEDQTSGPDVRILTDKHATIEEYRANGKVYMIKITPKKGPPYYLVDADGDGELETRRNDILPNLLIPSWVIFSW